MAIGLICFAGCHVTDDEEVDESWNDMCPLGQASVEPHRGLGSVEIVGIWARQETRAWADEKGAERSSGEAEDRRGRKSPGRALGAEAGSLAPSRVAELGLGCARNLAGEV
ncbi:hypothetical protein ACLB2K_066937 [Fragaria x ananassa]